METLENTLSRIHNWTIDRIHYLCERDAEIISNVDDAYAIQCEFSEWLDSDVLDHDIVSLEYIGDEDRKKL